LCTNSRSAGESQKNQNRAKFVEIVIAAHRNKKKEKDNSINILAIQHAFTRIFNYTEKLSSDSSKSLSLHTLQAKKLCNSPTHDTLSLSSLSLSPAPYGGKFKPEWAGIRNCTPRPLRVSNSTTIVIQK
jgi:hypothetical protein